MRDFHNSFIGRTFLRSIWDTEYKIFQGSAEEQALDRRLLQWSQMADLKETTAEGALVEEFFRQTWGYTHSGQDGGGETFTLYPKFPIPGAGDKGGQGLADLAIGYFAKNGNGLVPQILAEFKDIKSALDAPQKSRKGNISPVKQCLNYLSLARRGMFGNEPVLPQWGIVTDMNEFRLYWHDRAPQQFIRFIVRQTDMLSEGMVTVDGRLVSGDEARFDRFLFAKLFHRDTLISQAGKPQLLQLVEKQWVRERELEKAFYAEYRAYRETLYQSLVENNPTFPGTKGRLVRLAQKILDRCIFIFFCEDMGAALQYPAQVLRDFLIDRSRDAYFDPKGTTIWADLRRLFSAMNTGAVFGPHKINQFNGGLFAEDSELDAIIIPNQVFCQKGQGQNETSLYAHQETLLYLSASYNYAGGWAQGLTKPKMDDNTKDKADEAKADPSHSLGLYTLGRIFEQSITELEILEAEAENRPSLNKEGKRKRDGVYYTPEWVVERIVSETLGPRLVELKLECGWPNGKLPNEAQLDAYRERLEKFKVIDPACGSGAFLITVLRYLLDEFKSVQAIRQQVTGKLPTRDEDALVRDILRSNVYGVDINSASVEITRLALWLHTARGNQPLSSLEGSIKEGNSLINDDFFKGQIDLTPYDADGRERINTFNWEAAFPEVFAQGGFDAVVGNPPYVKLQNFRKVHSDMAEFIRDGRPEIDDVPGYASAKTGNFDLYLPFIEKGLQLLNDKGRLGYIAPSLWTVNDYGAGLRNLIVNGRNLDRWLDFKSHQIFEEATTYTALQFFSKSPNDAVKVAYAADGVVPDDPWLAIDATLPFDRIAFGDRWLLVTGEERLLIDRLQVSCKRLDDPVNTEAIFVGIQTSADEVYHLTRLGPNKYVHTPRGKTPPPPFEVAIEDAIMKPLVSGSEAKRYQKPLTGTYILFPYSERNGKMGLISATVMMRDFPNAWAYLLRFEDQLRKREAVLDKDGKFELGNDAKPKRAPFHDDEWYRFGRHQGLDRQKIEKLIVAQTVPSLRVCADAEATAYLNNVRVNGIITATDDLFVMLGILNAPVCDYVFRRIAKPKDGGWYEANKQFIAPLPIPAMTSDERREVSDRAKALQESHTALRDALTALTRRLTAVPRRPRPEGFLFPDLCSAKVWEKEAPKGLDKIDRRKWAKQQQEMDRTARYEAIGQRLFPGVVLDAKFEQGELSFLVDGVPVVDKVFVSDAEGRFVLAQWKAVASTFSITEKTTATKLCGALRMLVQTENVALVDQIIALQAEIETLESTIAKQEGEMNALVYRLYDLNDDEIRMVEIG